jgi:hypothetical protein
MFIEMNWKYEDLMYQATIRVGDWSTMSSKEN